MANSAEVKTKLKALQQSHMSMTLKNTLFNRMPALYMLFARDGDKSGPNGLGVPKTGIFLSGIEATRARKEEILGASVYEPIIQSGQPVATDGKNIGMASPMPVRSNWTTTGPDSYFTRPRVKWCEFADPYKVGNKLIRRTTRAAANEVKAWAAVTSLFKAETVSVLAVHLNRWQQMLWGTTGSGAPSNEDNDTWDTIHSFQNAIHDSNTYCGVDRSLSANSWFRGNRVTSAFQADFESLINYCNYDLGLAKKGTGIDLLLVDGANFKKAKSEAKAKGQTVIANGGMPDFGTFGFKRELVRIDNTWIVYDPECPPNHVAALSMETWTVAIHPDANFRVTEPFDQTKIEGGDDAQAGQVRTEVMVVCEVPSLNAYFTAVS
jgi:hypothetical protein